MSEPGPIVDNVAATRFELAIDGDIAYVEYEREGNRLVLTHTEVPVASRGRGVGSALVRGVLEIARARDLVVVPLCPFVASYIRSHPDDLDLVSEQDRHRISVD